MTEVQPNRVKVVSILCIIHSLIEEREMERGLCAMSEHLVP